MVEICATLVTIINQKKILSGELLSSCYIRERLGIDDISTMK